ncbi:coiled-coil domain-containing protein 127 [Bufo gargarizans]|uniref:coiled-coil domain-containing protein 127 n=1 Tax=Bufo gargarizans TaxID=30331 RepID=UPI001CF58A6B|nr:coiled-coil domain-containing protein 127 [Bufo gargarizans]XP_044150184.1 coiled-coil domain-containing protein 127 [Bufo gargarizans]
MNNLNNPPQWNIRPNGEGENGNKWNYALLVPVLGLAAFRWIWSKESEKEIRKATSEYLEKVTVVEKELETKYRDVIVEHRRAVAHLEIELEKEQNRTLSYRHALIVQSKKLVEERRQMELERDQLKQEIKDIQKSNKEQGLYTSNCEREEEWQTKAKSLLKDFEDALKERQNIYCSWTASKKNRLEIEKKMLVKAASNPVAAEVGMTDGLIDIFKHDNYCAELTNTNKRENGRLMWIYLKYWQLSVDVKKFKRLQEAMTEK